VNYAVTQTTGPRQCSSCHQAVALGTTMWMTAEGELFHPACAANGPPERKPVEEWSDDELADNADAVVELIADRNMNPDPLRELVTRFRAYSESLDIIAENEKADGT